MVIAIAAAAAAGIIGGAILYIGPLTRTASEPETGQRDLVMGWATPSNNAYRQVNITVNGVELLADIAATSDQKSMGLAVKDTLNDNEAMLFLFKTESKHTF